MSDISPLHSTGPLQRVTPQTQPAQPTSNGLHAGGGGERDSVEVSEMGNLLARLADLPDTREDLVSQVRTEIEAGTYLTDHKIEIAVDAMMEDLEG